MLLLLTTSSGGGGGGRRSCILIITIIMSYINIGKIFGTIIIVVVVIKSGHIRDPVSRAPVSL